MKQLEKYFVSYEESMELKRLGFNEECLFTYSSNTKELGVTLPISANHLAINIQDFNTLYPGVELCSAPLFQQAFNFFRDKYNLDSHIRMFNKRYSNKCYWKITDFNSKDIKGYSDDAENYHQAELDCLKKLISIVKIEYKNL